MTIDADVGCLIEPLSGRQWDRAEVLRQVAKRVHAYRSCGFVRGDRVLILFGNRLEFFAELLAIWRLGGCAIPVDSRLTPFEVAALAASAAARFGIIDDATNSATVSVMSGMVVLNTLDQDENEPDISMSGADPHPDDDAALHLKSASPRRPRFEGPSYNREIRTALISQATPTSY